MMIAGGMVATITALLPKATNNQPLTFGGCALGLKAKRGQILALHKASIKREKLPMVLSRASKLTTRPKTEKRKLSVTALKWGVIWAGTVKLTAQTYG